MCGIIGLYIKGRDVNLVNIIRKMCQSIIHRGPDDEGTYVYEDVAIGVRRLSIIDIEGGHQPIFSDDGRYAIVYNGELYNYLEVKQELLTHGVSFQTHSDTEVVLKAYLHFGEKCFRLFNGMYAFAIFDNLKKEFFLARDRIGVKPLYYTTLSGQGFAFASELKAFLEIPGFDRNIDHTALNQYLVFEYIPEPLSIFQKARKLPAGSWLRFSPHKGIKIRPYWELDPHAVEETDLEHAQEKIRSLMHSAVKYRVVSDVPVGLFLSGGIDSSVIAAEFKKCLHADCPVSFSIGFENKSYDEHYYAEEVAEYLDLRHQYEMLNEKKMLNLLPEIMSGLDEPLADASIIPMYLLSAFARRSVKVALSGDGGDELFLGYDTYRAHKFARFCRFLPRTVYKSLLHFLHVLPVSDNNVSFEFKLKKFFSALSFPPDITNILWWGAYPPEMLARILQSKSVAFEEIFEPVMRYREKLRGLDLLKQISFLDINLYLKDDLLPKVDRASMANSLEVRNPFLDYRLVEYAMKIPSSWKIKGNQGKRILKSAYRNELPRSILKRPKKGFDIPLTPWLRGPLKSLVEHYLSKKRVEDVGLFHYPTVRLLIEEHSERKRNHRQLLWPILTVQMWHSKYG